MICALVASSLGNLFNTAATFLCRKKFVVNTWLLILESSALEDVHFSQGLILFFLSLKFFLCVMY